MKIEKRFVAGSEHFVLIADEGNLIRRIHDGYVFEDEVTLGFDYSTGEKRLDTPEYYEEVDKEQTN